MSIPTKDSYYHQSLQKETVLLWSLTVLRRVKSNINLTKELTTYWNKWSGYWQKAKRRQQRSVRHQRSQTEELVVSATRHTHPHSGSGSVHTHVFQPPLLQHNMFFTKPNITVTFLDVLKSIIDWNHKGYFLLV